ncbi:carboxy terminal-processing peptidase [Candidatus Seongchinamella marina]|uniref:carboxy terminal-processing peptidase n=1 Tax=Candidatus Seongchinamella marina TaxID=2518990 RepID=UPI002431E3A6|nr:carboxy terminal-processing peptidase [Candidatus Seongchinamella marina]
MSPCPSFKTLGLALSASLIFGSFSLPSAAAIDYTDIQRETVVELVEQLEERHYSKQAYTDELSSQHLDAYIDSLDGSKMFLTAADIKEFQQYRTVMDDQLPEGNLDAGFAIFNRFQERLRTRLESINENLPEIIAAMDFTVDEYYELNTDDRDWATAQLELDERWRKHLKNQVLSLRLAEKSAEEIPETLNRRYTNQLKRVEQYNHQDVFQIYANALTELYDPHTNYFSPRRSENFNINMSLSLEGIGAVLQAEDEYTKVARLVPKGPADKQGDLEPSDKIVGVGQGDEGDIEDVIGWRLDEVVQLIRGPKDSTVRLQVIPGKSKSTDERKTITIVRNEVKLEEQSAQKEILEIPDGDDTIKVGVIDIPAFYIDFEAMRRGDKDYKSTTRDVKKLLQELQDEGVDGLVVDLRNNGGGSLQEANELTGLFIEYGPTVQIRHSSRRVWRDGKRLKSDYYEGPLVVLINRLSASASEIFAGAIQDYERGIIVGDRSFGKGTVQTLSPLTEGQLKITESKFYRISGDSTQHRGVVPDLAFPSLFDTEEIGESSLDHALNWDQINSVRHRRYDDLSSVLPLITNLYEERSEANPDFVYLEDQIAMATQTRKLEQLPLNEEKRIALRESQESKALAIENKRRVAKGEAPLTSLDEEEEAVEQGETDEVAEAAEQNDDTVADVSDSSEDTASETAVSDEDDTPDVLLTEAGNVLVDALVLKKTHYAANVSEKE